jgi:tetratricopeptide (TPR) repeat protein
VLGGGFLTVPRKTDRLAAYLALLLGLGCFSLLVALVTDLLRRFLAGGPDAESLPYLVFQTMLAVVTGSAFTATGAEWLEHVLTKVGVERPRVKQWRMLFLLCSLVVVIVLWTQMQAIASVYDRFGAQLALSGQTTTAIHRFQRSIALAPDYAAAHYNLGSAYEDVGEIDKALVEYQTALKADANFVPAYNNAARLLIRKKDYGTALQLLDVALSKRTPEKHIRYSLWKNRGSAHLGLDQLIQSEDDLHEALRNEDGAEANCLMAEVMEHTSGSPGPFWRRCLSASARDEKPDAILTSLAEERLRAIDKPKGKK